MNEGIVEGFIWDENDVGIVGAVIHVCEVDPINKVINSLGFCETTIDGSYFFTIENVSPDMYYELTIYSPLSIYNDDIIP